ncbi:MAG: hypothetical protein ABI641_03685 [Caldimonas sp.]
MSAPKGDLLIRAAAVAAMLFGLLTVASGGNALFGDEAARRAAGAYVDFVLWFNFVAGFFYVATGIGLWWRQRWAVVLALAVAVATLITFAVFGVHVLKGGAYEGRTVAAMSLRSVVWLAISWLACSKVWSGISRKPAIHGVR